MSEPDGRFTKTAMRAAMQRIATDLGVPADDAELLRLTNNAVFALPAAGIVIRVNRSHGLQGRVHKVVQLAMWFAIIGAPTIRLLDTIKQPIQVDNLLATVWHYVPPGREEQTLQDLGSVLRRFHALEAPPFALPVWDPVADVRERLEDAEALSDDDHAYLLEWCNRLRPRIAELNERVEPGLVHGDAHVGNLVRGGDGRPLLCDFDPTCLGPWQFDLGAVAIGEVRFGRVGDHRALAAAYGYDVTRDPAWPLLREARELKMVAGALPHLASAPGVAEEFAWRLRSIREGDQTARWRPFAEVGR